MDFGWNRIDYQTEMEHLNNNSYLIDQLISSGHNLNLSDTIYTFHQHIQFNSIYFFNDFKYPINSANQASNYGLYQHLLTLSKQKNVNMAIYTLNSSQLVTFLKGNNFSPLIYAAGAIPTTIYNKTANLFPNWINNGGCLVWIGPGIGLYESKAYGPSNPYGSIVYTGKVFSNIISNHSYGGDNTYYPNYSNISKDFGLNLEFGISGNDLRVSNSSIHILGNIGGNYTNSAYLPLGKGGVVYIGSPLIDESSLANSLLNLLVSSAIFVSSILTNCIVNLSAHSSYSNTEYIRVNKNLTKEYLGVFVVQTDYLGTFEDILSLPL